MSIYNVVSLEIRSRSPNLITSFPHPDVSVLVWSNSIHWLKRCAHKLFTALTRLTFLSIYSAVTLKIRSRSPKSNQFFASFLWCICASSFKFKLLVKEVLCTQTLYFINKASLGSFLGIYNVVTLKISSRSPKSNHVFPPYWWCICASLVKFHPLVKVIMCTQTFNCINKAHFFWVFIV